MVTIRLANKDDFDFFFDLKSEDYNVFWTGGLTKPKKENLRAFFNDAVDRAEEKKSRKIYIIENEKTEKVGHLYIIPNGEEYDLSIAIHSAYVGRGYAKQAIKLGLVRGEQLGYKRMVSCIREDNFASLKAYSACGVTLTNEVLKTVFIPKLEQNVKMYKVIYDYSKKS